MFGRLTGVCIHCATILETSACPDMSLPLIGIPGLVFSDNLKIRLRDGIFRLIGIAWNVAQKNW